MKKPTVKRLCLGCLQHLTAAVIMVIIAGITFNSYVAVDSMYGTQTYRVDSFDSEKVFEDSEIFRNIFETAVADITRLVVMKGQLETDGIFDPAKPIDITQYANRTGTGNDCPVTAVYELEDLIKWGKSGIEYTNRSMSMSDFVNYFYTVTDASSFALDENGQLYFRGFAGNTLKEREEADGAEGESSEEPFLSASPEDMQDALSQALQAYSEEQLEDMVFSYIITEIPQGISMSREEDGTLTVYFTMLNCRYETVDGERQLLTYADNWVDYMRLQNNLVDAITSLTANYQQYQNCNDLYQEGNTNLKYAVRMMTEDGLRTYTNVSELSEVKESEITEYFTEYRRYFIYYPDSLEFSGNTSLTEDDIYNYMREYEYAYPETTHLWFGVDTGYPVAGDSFYNAYTVFERLVPHMNLIVGVIAVLIAGWLAISIYLTVTAGIAYDEAGERQLYLNGIDHIWTEVSVLFGALFVYGCVRGFEQLLLIAGEVYDSHSEIAGIGTTSLYRYGVFALYGALVSLFFHLIWYSFVRRMKNKNIWRGSFVYWCFQSVQKGIQFVLTHSNTAVSTLLPYNFFLMMNLMGIFIMYVVREQRFVSLVTILVLVIFDGIVGMLLFKNSAERLDIVEGIRRIRNGEVDYKLDTTALHGTNKEMADAVNNIGEGIRKAVKTSMKDEQMKTDLITNVSHDIKTPLTSIISYVDLLKRLKIEEEPARSYIDILDTKSQRLKQLTDDLVEASKISSGNIELNREPLNLTELLNQSLGEFSEKLEDKRLQVIFAGSEVPAHIYADSRRMWRIMENLFNNICKYAMEGTRVYIDLVTENGMVELSIKNISERQMNIRADELTERFIRGDASRTTEGSGLGLSIARSLTEVQGGIFAIHLDGDLFKVVLSFPEYVEMPAGTEEDASPETEAADRETKKKGRKGRKRKETAKTEENGGEKSKA